MSEPIREGDLCVVVRTCCAATEKDLGIIGRAISKPTGSRCTVCGHEDYSAHFAFIAHNRGAPAWWFKRIPPLPELEDVRQDEEITA